MIKNIKALSLAEAGKLVGAGDEGKEIKTYIKKFSKIKAEKAEELRKEVEALDNIKIKQENISKIIDLLPEDNEDMSKIFSDVGLNEDETNKLLEIVKKYR